MRIEENKCRRDMYQAHKYISKNLRLLRYIKGLSQEQAADMLHMSRSCYCTLENGLKMPDIITLYDISTFYDISLDYLLSFDITEHMLSLLKRNKEAIEAHHFMENYLKLSHGARNQIRIKLESLADRDRSFNKFPWDYTNNAGV